jgi:cytochrome P450
MNAPDHARLRRLVSRAFTPAWVNALTPHIVTITRDLLHGIDSEAGPFDLVEGLALPLPVRVISELLGIPPADSELLNQGSVALSRALDPEAISLAATVRACAKQAAARRA